MNEKLKNKLENLSPSTKLNSILIVLLLYGVITIIMLIGAFNTKEKSISIQHIEPTPLIDSPMKLLNEKDSLKIDKFK